METVKTGVPKNPDAKTLNEKSFIFFGKNKGKTVKTMLDEAPAWIIWAQDNITFIKFTDSVLAAAKALTVNSAPTFDLTPETLTRHAEIMAGMESGLDSYGNEGIRELHGFTNDANIHVSLRYFSQLGKYLAEQVSSGTELGKLLTPKSTT